MNNLTKYICAIKSLIYMIYLKIKYRDNLKIYGIQNISNSTKIEIRKKSKIILKGKIHTKKNVELKAFNGGVLEIGKRCTFNNNCMIVSGKNIIIKDGTIFGPNVVVVDHDHDYCKVESILESKYIYDDIYIGSNVWIGANVVILRGTRIGDNSVIGAGCVIRGNIKNNTVITQNRKLNYYRINKEKIND